MGNTITQVHFLKVKFASFCAEVSLDLCNALCISDLPGLSFHLESEIVIIACHKWPESGGKKALQIVKLGHKISSFSLKGKNCNSKFIFECTNNSCTLNFSVFCMSNRAENPLAC